MASLLWEVRGDSHFIAHSAACAAPPRAQRETKLLRETVRCVRCTSAAAAGNIKLREIKNPGLSTGVPL